GAGAVAARRAAVLVRGADVGGTASGVLHRAGAVADGVVSERLPVGTGAGPHVGRRRLPGTGIRARPRCGPGVDEPAKDVVPVALRVGDRVTGLGLLVGDRERVA